MAGTIFLETLRRQWRSTLYWGLGLGILAFFILAIIPDVDMLQGYADLFAQMPPAIVQAFGVGDAALLATPEGFVGFGFFTYAILIMAVYSVMSGLSITANEEDEGIMDIVLALPIPRWRVVVEKFLASIVFVCAISLMSFIGLVLGDMVTPLDVNLEPLAASCLNMIPATLAMIAGTAILGTIFKRKLYATAAAAGIITGMYFLFFLGNSASDTIIADLSIFSVFYYYNAESVILEGLKWLHVVILTIVACLLLAGTVWTWERRDVGL